MVAQDDKWKQTQTSEIRVECFFVFWIELSDGAWGQKVDKQNPSKTVPTPGGKKKPTGCSCIQDKTGKQVTLVK